MSDVTTEYAEALYSLSVEEGITSAMLGDVRAIQVILKDQPGFIDILKAPNIPKEERRMMVDRAFEGRVHPYICSLMKLLVNRGRAGIIQDCLKQFEDLWYENSGIAVAEVKSAVSLTADQKNRLLRRLEQQTGKAIELTCLVDPGVIGGLSVTVDGCRIEGSVKNRIDTIYQTLLRKTL